MTTWILAGLAAVGLIVMIACFIYINYVSVKEFRHPNHKIVYVNAVVSWVVLACQYYVGGILAVPLLAVYTLWLIGWRTWRIPFVWQRKRGVWKAANRMLYLAVVLPMWSVVVNAVWIVRDPYWWWDAYKIADQELDYGHKKFNTVRHVELELGNFEWATDHWYDWLPFLSTYYLRQYYDDCDGAAYAATRLFQAGGVPAHMEFLFGPDGGHAVCVAGEGDERWVTSNGRVVAVTRRSYDDDAHSIYVWDYEVRHAPDQVEYREELTFRAAVARHSCGRYRRGIHQGVSGEDGRMKVMPTTIARCHQCPYRRVEKHEPYCNLKGWDIVYLNDLAQKNKPDRDFPTWCPLPDVTG